MKIYIIWIKEYDYESYYEHVIVANNRKEVVELASKRHGDEGSKIWETAKISKEGDYTGRKKKPFLLSSSFYAG